MYQFLLLYLLTPAIVEKKKSKYLSYTDQKFGKALLEEDLPKLFFEDLDFEKYAEFTMNFPILFIQHEDQYISGQKYII